MVASIIGYVFLALLALLVVLLLAPMVLGAELRDGQFTLWVRVLFVKMRLLPAREKPVKKKRKKPEKEEPEEEPREEEEQKTRGRTAQQWLELIRRIVSSFTAGMKLLCKMMLVYDVEVLIPVRADDPSQLAQRFGQVQAAVGAMPLAALTAAGLDPAPGGTILAMAVMSIAVTAPLGAWALDYSAERFLET